jgi:hypothetical protein
MNSTSRGDSLDILVHLALRREVGHEEPSPAVWERIEHHVSGGERLTPRRSALGRLADTLGRYALQAEQVLFSTSDWHYRLAERKAVLLTQTLAFPGAGIIMLPIT